MCGFTLGLLSNSIDWYVCFYTSTMLSLLGEYYSFMIDIDIYYSYIIKLLYVIIYLYILCIDIDVKSASVMPPALFFWVRFLWTFGVFCHINFFLSL
jgi:hypothetical protein